MIAVLGLVLAARASGLELISATPDGGFPDQVIMSSPTRLSISVDGRFVAFHSMAGDLVSTPADTNGQLDVFVRDRQQQTTQMVSVNAAGDASTTGASVVPILSADGSTVLFESTATDLVPGIDDDNKGFDVFARDLATGVTHPVSVDPAGTAAGDKPSSPIDISADGRVVFFGSLAINLVPNFVEANLAGQDDLFARDLTTGVTHWVTSNPAGTQGANRSAIGDAISADGRYALFETAATNLVGPIDDNDSVDVFLRDLETETTSLVSVNAAGTASGAGFARNARMSADGRFVSFTSTARDLVPDFVDGNREDEEDLYVRDMMTGETRLVSINAAGTASGNQGTLNARLPYGFSRNGRFIAFSSAATDLVTGVADGNRTEDVFVRDLETGVTTCVSTVVDGSSTGNAASLAPQVADGGTVVFRSTSNNLILGTGSKLNLFLRGTPGEPIELVTAHAVAATGADADTAAYVLSGDGGFVAFASPATNLVVGDTNATEDVFLYDVLAAPPPTATRTATVEPTATETPPPGSTETSSPTPTASPEATETGTATETVPPGSTETSTPTESATPESTATPSPTETVPPGSTATATSAPTDTVPPGSTATATSPPTETVPPGSTATASPTHSATPEATTTEDATPSPTAEPIVGDCDGNGRVTVDDLIKGVNIALDGTGLATCPSLDVDGNGSVTIDELIRAVANALEA